MSLARLLTGKDSKVSNSCDLSILEPDTSIRSVLHVAMEDSTNTKQMKEETIKTDSNETGTSQIVRTGSGNGFSVDETRRPGRTIVGGGQLYSNIHDSPSPGRGLAIGNSSRFADEVHLSGRDIFDGGLEDGVLFATYERTNSDLSSRPIDTPPSSLYATPPGINPLGVPPEGNSVDGLLPPAAGTSTSNENSAASVVARPIGDQNSQQAASLVSNSVTTSSSLEPSSLLSAAQPTVLYSAIGSLEDPSSGSFNKWRAWSRGSTQKNANKAMDFPSSSGVSLLGPTPQKKKSSSLAQKLSAVTHEDLGEGSLQTKATPVTSGLNTDQQSSAVGDLASNQTKSQEIPSILKKNTSGQAGAGGKTSNGRKVTIPTEKKKKKKPKEMFRPSSDAYIPRGKKEIKYMPAGMRTPVQQMATPLGTLQRPNFQDALRRVAMLLRQHIVKIERRFEEHAQTRDGLFTRSMEELFAEEMYIAPTYKCSMVRVPMARPGMVCGLKKTKKEYKIPTESEIYEFGHQLFKSVQLSSECSIVCLIYIERLMEHGKVPLLATTWRPIFMCGLLLASKVWQDLSSWNIEFASVFPQYPLESINRLEHNFLRMVKWDLYISSSAYAKYYFALRSLVAKSDFRQRYNRMVGHVDSVQASEALKVEARSTKVKEDALTQLSRSM